jgi:hypothetical protein
LVQRAKVDTKFAQELGFVMPAPMSSFNTHGDVAPDFKPGPRKLTAAEIQYMANVLEDPGIKTQRQVFKAMEDWSRSPILTSAAVHALGDIYNTPLLKRRPGRPSSSQPQVRAPYINISRVVEALIMKAGAIIETEESAAQTSLASTTGNDSQTGNKSSNTKARKANAAPRLHGRPAKTRAA